MKILSFAGLLWLHCCSTTVLAFAPQCSSLRGISLVKPINQKPSTILSVVPKDASNEKEGLSLQSKPLLSRFLGNLLLTTSLALALFSFQSLPATAADSRVVGKLQGSGLVFKDTLQIESFEDPKVRGVTLYISNFERPITERLSAKTMFSDPAATSVACAKTGPVAIADNIAKGPGGEEVFEESKSLLFKTLRVQRIYDDNTNTVVYVTFNTRLDKGDDSNKSRFKSSLCAVNLDDSGTKSSSSSGTLRP